MKKNLKDSTIIIDGKEVNTDGLNQEQIIAMIMAELGVVDGPEIKEN